MKTVMYWERNEPLVGGGVYLGGNIFRREVMSRFLVVGGGGVSPHPLKGKPCDELLRKEIVLQNSIVRKYSTKIIFFVF